MKSKKGFPIKCIRQSEFQDVDKAVFEYFQDVNSCNVLLHRSLVIENLKNSGQSLIMKTSKPVFDGLNAFLNSHGIITESVCSYTNDCLPIK